MKLFKGGQDARGTVAFTASRKEMGLATAAAAKLLAQAQTPSDQALAAQAEILVADQEHVDVVKLAALVGDVQGTVENKIAKAALADIKGRVKAMAVLTAVTLQAPVDAQVGLAAAIDVLATDPVSEVNVEANVLTDASVSAASVTTLAKTVKVEVTGQESASAELTQLLSASTTPVEAISGLQTAYDAVTAQHGQIADILSRLSPRMPDKVRTFVSAVITQARTDARSMQANRPTPPTGGRPTSTPGGAPTTTPGAPSTLLGGLLGGILPS